MKWQKTRQQSHTAEGDRENGEHKYKLPWRGRRRLFVQLWLSNWTPESKGSTCEGRYARSAALNKVAMTWPSPLSQVSLNNSTTTSPVCMTPKLNKRVWTASKKLKRFSQLRHSKKKVWLQNTLQWRFIFCHPLSKLSFYIKSGFISINANSAE